MSYNLYCNSLFIIHFTEVKVNSSYIYFNMIVTLYEVIHNT